MRIKSIHVSCPGGVPIWNAATEALAMSSRFDGARIVFWFNGLRVHADYKKGIPLDVQIKMVEGRYYDARAKRGDYAS